MKIVILSSIFIASALTGSVSADEYNPYVYRSERYERQMDQLQRDIDRLPRYGHVKPDGSGDYYYTY